MLERARMHTHRCSEHLKVLWSSVPVSPGCTMVAMLTGSFHERGGPTDLILEPTVPRKGSRVN